MAKKGDQGATKSGYTRERILDATASVLCQKGYAGTRLSDVADVAELQAPALYYYFDSRDELIEEVVRLGQQRAQQHVREALDALPADTPPLDRLCAAVEAHLRVVLELSDYTMAAIRNLGQLPEGMRRRMLAEQRQYGKLWEELVADVHAAGIANPDVDLLSARMLIVGALNWAPEWWNPRRTSVDDVVHTARTLVRHGLRADKRSASKTRTRGDRRTT
ncbi:MAG: TetR family transcriptional regulator [Streptosporangiales bacterium]|nr:TetR family transcriptional regulator [Streptosporangiales bacterium]